MKRQLYFLFLLLLSVQFVKAQTVRYEYWLDNDHHGRTVVADSVDTIALDLDISAMKSGLHYFNFRTQDASGQWGGLSRYLFFVGEEADSTAATMRQYEYWLDNQHEMRTTVEGSTSEVLLDLDISSLKSGLHYFNFRTQGKNGQWGGLSHYLFFIGEEADSTAATMTQYEYWLDNQHEMRTTVKGSTSEVLLDLDISSLKPGLHYFNFRTQGKSGQWGGLSRYLFFIKDGIGQLAHVEYWLDHRQDVNTQQVTDSTIVITMDISNLEKGHHTFYMEGVGESGYRGMLNGYEFNVDDAPEPEPYAVLSDNNTVLTFYYDAQKGQRNGMGIGPFPASTSVRWDGHQTDIKKVVFDSSFDAYTGLTSTRNWFRGCNAMTTITGIEYLHTDNVTDMDYMFYNCISLEALDVSHFNTANVTNMFSLFYNCSLLPVIDVSGFNTSKVVHFGNLFYGCSSVTSLDVSHFDTSASTSTSYMFAGCSKLATLDVSGFNTANVTDMSRMFVNCSSLISLDLSNFNTSNVTNIQGMFSGCSSLAAIQAGNANIPAEEYAQIQNPNLLVYVNNASLAPQGVQNVVVNGVAQEIVLTDVESGNNNFFVPQSFTAGKVSYTRNFTQQTQPNVSRGWESISLPFNVQNIVHETKGNLSPFGSSAEGKKFWLRRLADNGLTRATQIAANVPYVISMPNSTEYTDLYNLSGRVTFSSQNITVPATTPEVLALADSSIVMMPTTLRVNRSSSVWAINVGEVRGQYLEGSVFERDYREVRPFEAYTVHRSNGPAPRFVPIVEMDSDATGIEDVRGLMSDGRGDQWYDLKGNKLQQKPTRKGVYILNGRKVVVE